MDFIVMEYVEGETLDRLIPGRGMQPTDLLPIAMPAAGALATAHEAGIIHRNLKTGNVMVSGKGLVKVLDFGIARLMVPSAPGEADTTRNTTHPTVEGTIVGTASYMSPEQAEGKDIDARSDIFSFGSPLYEVHPDLGSAEGWLEAGSVDVAGADGRKPALVSRRPEHRV